MPSGNKCGFLSIGVWAIFVSSALGQYDDMVFTTRDDPDWILAVSSCTLRNEACGEIWCDDQLWSYFVPVSGPPCMDDFPDTSFYKPDPYSDGCPVIWQFGPCEWNWVETFYVRPGVRFRLVESRCNGDTGQMEYTVGAPQIGPKFFGVCDGCLGEGACWEFEPGTVRLPPTTGDDPWFCGWGCGYTNSGLGWYGVLFECDWPPPSGSATDRPPTADDRTFVADSAPATGTEIYSHGPIEFDIPVTRFAGWTTLDGTLANVETLLENGMIGEYATLSLMCWDVDSDADPAVEGVPEMDRVYFNGELLSALDSGNSQFLEGADGQWCLNTFRIPIEKVRFPATPGHPGSAPTPQANQVRIEVDVGNASPYYRMAVDWGSLEIEVMSPIILIHGINSTPMFFDQMAFTAFLESNGIVFDNTLLLAELNVAERRNRVADDALDISEGIPLRMASFGVDSVHLVAHSKGGLDARRYLAAHYIAPNPSNLRILSLTTLSTPHDGSILADIEVAYADNITRGVELYFPGFPGTQTQYQFLAESNPIARSPGYQDLQTTVASSISELLLLPTDVIYNTVAADADLNGNGSIDNSPDEYAALRDVYPGLGGYYQGVPPFGGPEAARSMIDVYYQTLRTASGLKVTLEDDPDGTNEKVVHISAVPVISPQGNDTLVTVPSGRGLQWYDSLAVNRATLSGAQGRNHANVADDGVAAIVIPWLRDIDRARGDLGSR